MASKTLVEIDRELLERARAILGTRTIRQTVGRALAEVVAADARRRHAARMAAAGDREEARPRAWG
ncbi:MAG TPA: type II toxin-antitoxin system VapB family antitoxin [Actinomycetes bacterium]|nr:type II toxin-antitoxin system VapB family antitoxin [Actinomycetes bacterium]